MQLEERVHDDTKVYRASLPPFTQGNAFSKKGHNLMTVRIVPKERHGKFAREPNCIDFILKVRLFGPSARVGQRANDWQ